MLNNAKWTWYYLKKYNTSCIPTWCQ